MTTSTDQDVTEHLPWWARRAGMGWTLLITGGISILATFILVYERVQLWLDPNHVTSCDLNPWVSCGQVMQSWQATLFGFPNQFIGMVGYPVIITIATLLLAGVNLPRWYWNALSLGSMVAMIFCLWLWTQAVYDINVLCLYCMVVWAATIPMAILVTSRNILVGDIPASRGVQAITRTATWPVIILLYVVIAGSILLRFGPAIF